MGSGSWIGRAAIPVGRIGLPEDIWLAVRFVIECEYFTGRTRLRKRQSLTS